MDGSPVDDVRDVAFGADPGRAVVVAPGAPGTEGSDAPKKLPKPAESTPNP